MSARRRPLGALRPGRRRRQRGVATMEVVVFCGTMLLFWVAGEHFSHLWGHVHHLKIEAGNLAFDRSIGKNAPGSVKLPSDHSATVSSFSVGAANDRDFTQQLRQHQNVPPLAYEQLLNDPKLANQKSGVVGVRVNMTASVGSSGWLQDRTFQAAAQVQVTPIEPQGIAPNRDQYDWDVASKIRDELSPFQGFR